MDCVNSAIDANGQPADAKVSNLARTVSRFRKGKQPINPPTNDKKFAVDETHMPSNFYRGFVEVEGERHLIFASEEQLGVGSTMFRCFVDGTHKLPSMPFIQLFSISGFIRFGGRLRYDLGCN